MAVPHDCRPDCLTDCPFPATTCRIDLLPILDDATLHCGPHSRPVIVISSLWSFVVHVRRRPSAFAWSVRVDNIHVARDTSRAIHRRRVLGYLVNNASLAAVVLRFDPPSHHVRLLPRRFHNCADARSRLDQLFSMPPLGLILQIRLHEHLHIVLRVCIHHLPRDGVSGLDAGEVLVREEDAVPRAKLLLREELARRDEDRSIHTKWLPIGGQRAHVLETLAKEG